MKRFKLKGSKLKDPMLKRFQYLKLKVYFSKDSIFQRFYFHYCMYILQLNSKKSPSDYSVYIMSILRILLILFS